MTSAGQIPGSRAEATAGSTALRFCLLAALGLWGCQGREVERAEAEQVTAVVHRLRDAPATAKRPHLEELERVHCTTPDASRLRATCLAAYRAFVAATDQIDRAAARVRPEAELIRVPNPVAETELAAGEALLERSRQGARDCADQEYEVRRTLRIP